MTNKDNIESRPADMNSINDLISYSNNVKVMPRNMAPSRGLYPSGQYLEVDGVGYGQCPRKVYYQNLPGFERTAIERLDRMAFMGNQIEDGLIEYMKNIGVMVSSQYQVVDTEKWWSGKIDMLTYGFEFTGFKKRSDVKIDHSVLIPIELKTVWGYAGKLNVIKTNSKQPFEPKPNAVMQISLYIDFLQKKNYPIPYGKIWYIGRDEGDSASHTIEIIKVEEENGFVSKRIHANGKWYKGFTIEGIENQNLRTKEAIDTKTLPERSFTYQYSENKISQMHKNKELNMKDSKLAAENRFVEKGDIQCRYCDFVGECYKDISPDKESLSKELYSREDM